MKKFALATVMSLIAASAMASGAPTDSYPYGYQPHGDLSAVTKEQPRAVPHRPAEKRRQREICLHRRHRRCCLQSLSHR